MIENKFKIVGLGEVLWDVLPTGKHLGGAPANFAYISTQLGNQGIIASKIGDDTDGKEISQMLENKDVDHSYLQIDKEKPTGTVKVSLENGQPSYEITENVAWDFLEFTADWQNLAKTCDAVCFGSLAQRNEVSKKTIQDFVKTTQPECLRVFDVNLRQKYFSIEVLRESLNLANIVKLNHEELPKIAAIFGLKGVNLMTQSKELRERFNLKMVCITRGGEGSVLISPDEISEHRGIRVEIADTIGAGDAFTATLTHGILQGWELDRINAKANKIAAFVASNRGAMPDFEEFRL